MKNLKSKTLQPILKLQHRLSCTINNLYHMAFSIGLQWEWQELKSEIKDRGWLPLDMAHLKVIEHPAVPGIIRMIEILEEARGKFPKIEMPSNVEHLFSIDVGPVQDGWLSEDYSEEENQDMWQQNLFVDLLSIFEACWALEYSCSPPMPVYDEFGRMYFNGDIRILSSNEIVQLITEALNEVLKVNRNTFLLVKR